MSLEDVIRTVFLGVESGVLSMLVFGVMENSLTSPELLRLDSYSPSEQPKCCTGVGTARNGTSSEVGFYFFILFFFLVIFQQLDSTLERIATQLEIYVGTWYVQP